MQSIWLRLAEGLALSEETAELRLVLSRFIGRVGSTRECHTVLIKTAPTLDTLSKYSPAIWSDTLLSVGWVVL